MSVFLTTPIRNTALFFITLRELYVNGIVVIDENKLVGRISPKHILNKILEEVIHNA